MLTRWLEHRHAGAVLAIVADACFVLMDGLVQVLELKHGLAVEQILFMQMAFTAVLAFVYLYRQSDPHLARCLLPEGRSCPAMYLLLKEPYSLVQGLASAVSFGGTLLIVKPAFLFGSTHREKTHPLRWLGLLLAFTSMTLSAVDFFLLRKIGRAASAAVLLLLYSTCGTFAGTVLWLISWEPFVGLSLSSSGILLFIVVFGVMAQITLIAALQRETGTIVAILGYLQVAQAVGLQWVFQGSIPTATSLVGMIIIVAAGIWSIVKTDPLPAEKTPTEDEQTLLQP